MRVVVGDVVTWREASWIVGRVGRADCLLVKPGEPTVTKMARRVEVIRSGPWR